MKSLVASNFRLASCQATVFTPDGDLAVGKAMKEFYPALTALFDGEPTVLPPMPEGAPLEIPRIILESGTHEWRCELSPARANIFWRRTKTTTMQIGLGKFFDQAAKVLLQYKNRLDTRVGRVAGLATRIMEQESPGIVLARHFCKERWDRAPLNRPENFELHAHKRFKLAGKFEVNSWARSKSGLLKENTVQHPIILFEQDLNTFAEETSAKGYRDDEIKDFFSAVTNELDVIIQLYYPDHGKD